jgi:diguanylate cyclase (GGDEF)-like protein
MNKKHLIVILDDEEENLSALKRTLLSADHSKDNIFITTHPEVALEYIKKNPVSLVISDQKMPLMDGFEFLGKVQKINPNIIRIILTGYTETKDLMHALNKIKPYRYLTKPWDDDELKYIIDQALVYYELTQENHELLNRIQDKNRKLKEKQEQLNKSNVLLEKKVNRRTKALRDANEQLKKLAATDGLTKIPNHRTFMNTLSQELERAKRYERVLSLVMVDVDYFKNYNDKYGHQAGDKILIHIARILEKSVRASDIVARYGGEEFTLILPETTKSFALETAERIRESVEKKIFRHKGLNEKTKITLSLGVAAFPDDADTVNKLIEQADRALYSAKSKGRNKVMSA